MLPGTITSWIKKGKIKLTVAYPFGSKQIYLFSSDDAVKIRQELEIPEHTEETMKQDFFSFFGGKRFLYHSKDLGVISMNHALFSRMEESDFQRVKEQMLEDIRNYYKDMGV